MSSWTAEHVVTEHLPLAQIQARDRHRELRINTIRIIKLAAALGYTQQANNPQQSWGFEGEPPEAVTKDFGTRDGTS
jgi:hypothetical protein